MKEEEKIWPIACFTWTFPKSGIKWEIKAEKNMTDTELTCTTVFLWFHVPYHNKENDPKALEDALNYNFKLRNTFKVRQL